MSNLKDLIDGIYFFRPQECPYVLISFLGVTIIHGTSTHKIKIDDATLGEQQENEYFTACGYQISVSLSKEEPTIEIKINDNNKTHTVYLQYFGHYYEVYSILYTKEQKICMKPHGHTRVKRAVM